MLNTSITREQPMATSVRLAPETERRLDVLAERTGRTKAFYLREIIENGLGDLEDYYLAAETLQRLRKGDETTLTLDEAEAKLGLAD
jgi:RHH-type rel operon transcriptional repressor/antitoxin RelB